MTYDKLNGFTKKVSNLADSPSNNMTPAQIKEWFDSSPEELRTAFNNLVDKLNVEDADMKARLVAVSNNLNTLNSLTNKQVQEISDLFSSVSEVDYKIAKFQSADYDYSEPVAVSPSGIPYMFFVTNDGVLGVEERVANKTYYQDYVVSPDGNKFQVFAENDGTLVVFKLT